MVGHLDMASSGEADPNTKTFRDLPDSSENYLLSQPGSVESAPAGNQALVVADPNIARRRGSFDRMIRLGITESLQESSAVREAADLLKEPTGLPEVISPGPVPGTESGLSNSANSSAFSMPLGLDQNEDARFTRPRPIWGKLIPKPGSFLSTTINLDRIMTSFGRAKKSTFIVSGQESRVSRSSFAIQFFDGETTWPEFEASGKDFKTISDMRPFITTDSSNGIHINRVKMLPRDSVSDRRPFGELFTGDEISIWDEKGSYLIYTCEFYYGRAQDHRPGFPTFENEDESRFEIRLAPYTEFAPSPGKEEVGGETAMVKTAAPESAVVAV
jgi:hypothetical protein